MSTTPFNELSPAEAERLAMLAEEAAEIVLMVGKILRHGYDSYHPDDADGTTNKLLLEEEVTDLRAVLLMMSEAGDLDTADTHEQIRARVHQKLRWTHHQERH